MNLFNLKETTDNTGVSRATIYRFYKDNPALWNETKLKKKKRVIPEEHFALITKTDIYKKAVALNKQTSQLKRLVRLLSNPNTVEYKLYQMDWDWFGTIAFKNNYSKRSCFHRMSQAFDFIQSLYGAEINLRLFFTVEPFINRTGSHIHFIIKVGNGLFKDAVLAELKKFFINDRTEFKPYDKYQGGIFYISKEGLQGEEWDILGNDLAKDSTNK